MLECKQEGPVTVYRMGRNIGSTVLYYVHCFVLGEVLIDTGTVYAADELLGQLKQQRISAIINTHYHEDHTGNNQLLQQILNADIYAHPEALWHLQNPESRLRLYLKLCWSYPQPSTGLPLGDHIVVGKYTLQIIHTPGHSPDHICLYEHEEKLLFTGDLFCGERVKYLRADENFKLLLASLKKLDNLNVNTICCAVSGIIPEGQKALKSKIEFMEKLQDDVRELNIKGMPPGKIRSKLLGREGMMYYLSAGHFSKQNLINSILES